MTSELHLLAAQAWPAREQVELEGWLLRASAGVTLRANSALPLVESPAPLDDLLGAVEDFYDARLLPPRVQVADAALQAELEERGWAVSDGADLLAGPLPDGPAGAAVAPLDDAWVHCWWAVDGRGGDAERQVARSMLEQVRAPVAHVRLEQDGAVVGVARGVAQGAWLGVFQVAVLPAHRRRGAGRQLLAALGAWGAEQGCAQAYLQARHGHPARALYAGFEVVGGYTYATRVQGGPG